MCDDVNSDCQTLIAKDPTCHGWVKIQRRIHEFTSTMNLNKIDKVAKKFANSINWDRKYFILSGQIIFIFKSDTSKRAERVLRLAEFLEVNETQTDFSDVPWPIEMKKRHFDKLYIFAPISEKERNKWIECLRNELDKLPSDDNDRNSRPLPVLPKNQNGQKHKNRNSSINITEKDEDSDDYELPIEYLDPVGQRKARQKQYTQDGISYTYNDPEEIKALNEYPKTTLKAKDSSFKDIAREFETKRSQTLRPTTRSSTPPLLQPKPKFSTLSATSVKAPQIVTIRPTTRGTTSQPVDDGIYEFNVTKTNKVVDTGFWAGSADQATEIIKNLMKHEGTFLVRNSKESDGYTLSVINNGVIRKFPIQKSNKQLEMGGKTFNDLEDLVSFFKKNNLPQKDFKLENAYSYYQNK